MLAPSYIVYGGAEKQNAKRAKNASKKSAKTQKKAAKKRRVSSVIDTKDTTPLRFLIENFLYVRFTEIGKRKTPPLKGKRLKHGVGDAYAVCRGRRDAACVARAFAAREKPFVRR